MCQLVCPALLFHAFRENRFDSSTRPIGKIPMHSIGDTILQKTDCRLSRMFTIRSPLNNIEPRYRVIFGPHLDKEATLPKIYCKSITRIRQICDWGDYTLYFGISACYDPVQCSATIPVS